jgi:tetratricopeptide (TPR) repeat protein
MPLTSHTLARIGRRAAVAVCLGALVVGAGCRKSARDIAEEKRSEREDQMEADWRLQQAEARARNLFQQGRDLRRQGRYKEAVEAWAEAVSADERADLAVLLAKNSMADEMLDKAHYQMHRPYENPAYPRTSRLMLDTILDEKNSFLEKHVTRAHKELDEWEWIGGGWEKYARAQKLIDAHKLAEALDILESICKNYPRTPLADKCILLLKQYGRD